MPHAEQRASRRPSTPVSTTDQDSMRLVARVAWMYHVRSMKQSDVAEALGLSQSRVSRLLDTATSLGIVRTTVRIPAGLHLHVEQSLINAYGLRGAHVFDLSDTSTEPQMLNDLGNLLATHLSEYPLTGDIIGITSWSRTLRQAVRVLEVMGDIRASYVVEMLGDVGPHEAQHEAAEVTQQLARLTGAQARFLRVPGVVGSVNLRTTLLEHDAHARETLSLFDRMDEALVAIGTCTVDPPLRAGENFFTHTQLAEAQKRGAVGQVNLRFIDSTGQPIKSKLDDLVIGVSLEQLRACPRTIAVAGGPNKHAAIHSAIAGGWVNTIVTDVDTANYLMERAV